MWLKRKERPASLDRGDYHDHSHEGCTACPEHGGPKSASRRRFMAGAVAGGAVLLVTKFLPPLMTPVLAQTVETCMGQCCPCVQYGGSSNCRCHTRGCGSCPFGCSPDKSYYFYIRCYEIGTTGPCGCGSLCYTEVLTYCGQCSGCRTI